MDTIIPISSSSQIHQAATVLFHAFANDPLVLWFFDNNKEAYEKYGLSCFKSWVRWTKQTGLALSTNDFESVALWQKPDKHDFTFWQLLISGMMFTPFAWDKGIRERVAKYEEIKNSEYQKQIGSNQFWYCWILGTTEASRGMGFAKFLMRYVFKIADDDRLPCCLETSKKDNVMIYEKMGFNLFSTLQMPNSNVTLYFMIRKGP